MTRRIKVSFDADRKHMSIAEQANPIMAAAKPCERRYKAARRYIVSSRGRAAASRIPGAGPSNSNAFKLA